MQVALDMDGACWQYFQHKVDFSLFITYDRTESCIYNFSTLERLCKTRVILESTGKDNTSSRLCAFHSPVIASGMTTLTTR
jgi:hypothetical protein